MFLKVVTFADCDVLSQYYNLNLISYLIVTRQKLGLLLLNILHKQFLWNKQQCQQRRRRWRIDTYTFKWQ